MDDIRDHGDNVYSENEYEDRDRADEMMKEARDLRDEELALEAQRLVAEERN